MKAFSQKWLEHLLFSRHSSKFWEHSRWVLSSILCPQESCILEHVSSVSQTLHIPPGVTSSGWTTKLTAGTLTQSSAFPLHFSSSSSSSHFFSLGNLDMLTFYFAYYYFMIYCGLKEDMKIQVGRPPAEYTSGSIVEKLHLTLNCRNPQTTRKGNPREQFSNLSQPASWPHPLLKKSTFFFYLQLWTKSSPSSPAPGYWAGQWQNPSWWLLSSQWTFTTGETGSAKSQWSLSQGGQATLLHPRHCVSRAIRDIVIRHLVCV